MTLIEKEVPGIYIHSISIGNGITEDTLNGFFKNVNDQVNIFLTFFRVFLVDIWCVYTTMYNLLVWFLSWFWGVYECVCF